MKVKCHEKTINEVLSLLLEEISERENTLADKHNFPDNPYYNRLPFKLETEIKVLEDTHRLILDTLEVNWLVVDREDN